MKKILALALLAAGLVVVPAATPVASAYYCSGTIEYNLTYQVGIGEGIIGCTTAGVTWYRAKVKCGYMEGAPHVGGTIYPAPTFTYGPKIPLEGARPYSWVHCGGAYPYLYSGDAEYGNG